MSLWGRVMRLQTPLQPWSTALFTALGLSPLGACGGTTLEHDGTNVVDGGPGRKAGTGGARSEPPSPPKRGSGGLIGAGGTQGAEPRGTGGAAPRGSGGAIPIGSGGRSSHFIEVCLDSTPQIGVDGKPTGF